MDEKQRFFLGIEEGKQERIAEVCILLKYGQMGKIFYAD